MGSSLWQKCDYYDLSSSFSFSPPPRLSLCGVIDEGADSFQDKQTRKHTNSFPPELISSGPPRRARPARHTQKIPLKEQLKSHDHELDDDSPADRPSLMPLDGYRVTAGREVNRQRASCGGGGRGSELFQTQQTFPYAGFQHDGDAVEPAFLFAPLTGSPAVVIKQRQRRVSLIRSQQSKKKNDPDKLFVGFTRKKYNLKTCKCRRDKTMIPQSRNKDLKNSVGVH